MFENSPLAISFPAVLIPIIAALISGIWCGTRRRYGLMINLILLATAIMEVLIYIGESSRIFSSYSLGKYLLGNFILAFLVGAIMYFIAHSLSEGSVENNLAPNRSKNKVLNHAVFAHAAGLTNSLIIFSGIITTLVYWLIMRGKDPIADKEGRLALNHQITFTLACAVLFAMSYFFTIAFGVASLTYIALVTINIYGVYRAIRSGSHQYRFSYPWLKVAAS